MILSWEKRLPLQHLCKDTSRTPDVHLHVVFLPREHDLGRSVVSCRDVSSHLCILNAGQTEIADLQITVLVDKDVTGLQVAVHNSGRMHVFQTTLDWYQFHDFWDVFLPPFTYEDLVEEVLDELLLERSGLEEAVKVGSEEFGDEVTGDLVRCATVRKALSILTCPRGVR